MHIRTISSAELRPDEVVELRRLFDAAYADDPEGFTDAPGPLPRVWGSDG